MDVDRRYYNRNTGSASEQLREHQPRARLPAARRPAGTRLRAVPAHRLGPLPRRAPAGVRPRVPRAGRRQLLAVQRADASSTRSRATSRSRRAGGSCRASEVLNYALFAYGLPERPLLPGPDRERRLQPRLPGLDRRHPEGRPDVLESGRRSRRRTRTRPLSASKIKTKAPPPSSVTVTVLNGSGIAGAAAEHVVRARPARLPHADPAEQPQGRRAGGQRCSTRRSTTTRRSARAKAAAEALQNLMQPAEVAKLPRTPRLLALDPGSMLVVVLGTAFHAVTRAPQHRRCRSISRRTSASTRRRAQTCCCRS